MLVGADTFVEIELWARERIDWLRGYLRLENGIPSHDTFGRLFGLIRDFPLAHISNGSH